MKKLIRELFFLRRGERRALYIVMLLLLFSALVRIYISTRPLPEFQPDEVFTRHMEEIREQIDSVLKQEQAREQDAGEKRRTGKWGKGQQGIRDEVTATLKPATFDPNTVAYDTLLAMNLSSYVSRNIIRYREAGGIFRQPSDLEKIYGLEKEMYDALFPYIVIARWDEDVNGGGNFPDDSLRTANGRENTGTYQGDTGAYQGNTGAYQENTGAYRENTGTYRENTGTRRARAATLQEKSGKWSEPKFPLELNSADSADLIALPGIGPWFAGRIIRYRELLGGFVNPVQLLEVYGMDTTRYNGIISIVTADSTRIQRIDLNNSTFQEVISHPYINREETYAIFRYRDFVDSILDPENILRDQIIDRERFIRMVPYLTAEGRMD